MITKARLQFLQSLRIKKFRQKYHQFLVEGDKSVTELLTSDMDIVEIFILPDSSLPANELRKYTVTELSKKDMERLSVHQSISQSMALVGLPDYKTDASKLTGKPLLAFDNIQDPGNMGTLIRLADWYGISDILCSEDCVDIYNPKTINATMGSFTRVKVHSVNLPEFLPKLKMDVLACTMTGENLHKAVLPKNSVLVIGNEGHGISDDILKITSKEIGIPRYGKAESLNAAIAAAIVLDNFFRKD